MSKISSEINTIFADNEKGDLIRFIEQRQRMNAYHIRMRYLFHTVQCTSMFITTFAVGYFTPLCIENAHGNVAFSLISRPLVGVLNEKRCNNSSECTGQYTTHYQNVIWFGIGLNMLATLIQAYEHVNQSVSKKMLNDIRMIKTGKYIDESDYADSKRNVSTKPSGDNV